jgi:hypothetical protein
MLAFQNLSMYLNSQMIVNMTSEEFLDFYTNVYLYDDEIIKVREISFFITISLMTLGTIGNVISITVFVQNKLRENKFNLYLLIISIFKLIFCSFMFADYLFSKLYKEPIFLHQLNTVFNKIIDFTLHTSDSCISLLSVLVIIDRLYAIKNSIMFKKFITYLHAKCLIMVSLAVLMILTIISFTICELNINHEAHVVYCAIVSPTIFNTIPALIILILNVLLIKEVIKYNKRKTTITKDLDSNQTIQIDLIDSRKSSLSPSIKLMRKLSTRIIDKIKKSEFFVVMITDVWCVVTSIPYYLLSSYFIIFHLNFLSIENLIKTQIISSILFNSNHSINFFIYLCFYDDFRNVFLSFSSRLCFRKIPETLV